jgi:ubiquinone/menaquinone biosynthesis C-methylase UbiE
MLTRELEPELMDDPQESQAYDNMDHAAVNRKFVEDLLAAGWLDESTDATVEDSVVLDLGAGTAQIPIVLCGQCNRVRVVASDAAVSMLEIAKINVAVAGFEHRIELHHGDGKQLLFDDALFDGVMSNSLLHHLPEPSVGLSEMLRVLKPGGWLFVRDLLRPSSVAEVEQLVATYAGDETADCQQLLRQSLHAALSLDEMRLMARQFDLPVDCLAATSDRHWTLSARKPKASE